LREKIAARLSVNDANNSIGEMHLTWFAVLEIFAFTLFVFAGLQAVGQRLRRIQPDIELNSPTLFMLVQFTRYGRGAVRT
jgi:hypothetical protein